MITLLNTKARYILILYLVKYLIVLTPYHHSTIVISIVTIVPQTFAVSILCINIDVTWFCQNFILHLTPVNSCLKRLIVLIEQNNSLIHRRGFVCLLILRLSYFYEIYQKLHFLSFASFWEHDYCPVPFLAGLLSDPLHHIQFS